MANVDNVNNDNMIMLSLFANYDNMIMLYHIFANCENDDDISHISARDCVSCRQYEGNDKNKGPNAAVNPDLRIGMIETMMIVTL